MLMGMVDESVKASILQELSAIEKESSVQILFAIESGSRAWGFPSKDSDYDVRFVYVHPKDWYLSVFEERDVIECPISEQLDICGWDLKKALGLLRRSNPSLMEWLTSPIKYRERDELQLFRDFANEAFLPIASFHHYFSMTRSQIRSLEGSDEVRLKRYFYVMRPLLAAMWVSKEKTQPPILFSELVDAFLPSGPKRRIVDDLLAQKATSVESDTIRRIPLLEKWLQTQLLEVETNPPDASERVSKEACNVFFRQILQSFSPS